ncbi:DUF5685 family protein [Butyrivibrio sp. MC2013]|uniref:DUF5685 family protein n=1 Tax=Butyrivibrio sp. MC2013 TaxID=1280686 RepID=UPI000429CDEC|nr:DUF5685 family protein [Butyrivibrio sp. MC2013]
MFGYITVNKPELRFKDYDLYRAYYCGFCRMLKADYGLSGQATLTYDLTFLIMLLSGLYEPIEETGRTHCVVHPIIKQDTRTNEFSRYAADMNVLLAYYKCMDDWKDEKKAGKLLYSELLRSAVKKAKSRHPDKAAIIREGLTRINELEEASRISGDHLSYSDEETDKVSGLFGEIFGEIFCYKDDEWAPTLRRLGFYLGKFIYILDAWDDVEKDIKKGCYNPLEPLWRSSPSYFDDHCSTLLTMMISEACKAFELLPVIKNAELIRNILYSGVWTSYNQIHAKRSQRLAKAVKDKEDQTNVGSI